MIAAGAVACGGQPSNAPRAPEAPPVDASADAVVETAPATPAPQPAPSASAAAASDDDGAREQDRARAGAEGRARAEAESRQRAEQSEERRAHEERRAAEKAGAGSAATPRASDPGPPREPSMGPAPNGDVADSLRRQVAVRTRACYQQALKSDPSLSGKITSCSVTVRKDGGIVDARLTSDSLPPELLACVRRALLATKLPPPGKTTTLSCAQ